MGRILDLQKNGKSSTKPTFKGRILKSQEDELNRIKQEKEVLSSQGIATSTKKNRVKPTFLGNIIRTPLKLGAELATNAFNAGQIIGDIATGKDSKPIKPFSGSYLGKVEGLGKVNMGKSPLDPENLKTIKKSVGVGAELASYLSYGGITKGALQGTIKGISEEGAKETFKAFIKQNGAKLIKEGALTGASYTTGSQLQENADTGKKFSWKQALTDVVTSTVLTPVAAFGLKKLGDAIPTKKVTPEITPKVEPTPTPKQEIPTPKFDESGFRPVQEGEIIPNGYTTKMNVSTGEQMTNAPFKDIPKTETPPVGRIRATQEIPNTSTTQTPGVEPTINESVINKDVQNFARDMGENVDDFNRGTFVEWSKGLRNLDIKEVEQVALGGKKTIPTSIPEGAYLSYMKNVADEVADETGNIELVQKLSNSNIISKSAQSTVASKLSARGNTTDLLRDIKQSILKRKGTDLDKFASESGKDGKLFKNLKKKIEEITSKTLSKEDEKAIINSIFCK